MVRGIDGISDEEIELSYLHNRGPAKQKSASIRSSKRDMICSMLKDPYQKWTVFAPTGLFHRRWKAFCCSPAPASELCQRKPWAPGRRNGAEALRNAKRALFTKRKPTRDDMVIAGMVIILRGKMDGCPVIGGRGSFPLGRLDRAIDHHNRRQMK